MLTEKAYNRLLAHPWVARYMALFSVAEIAASRTLQWMAGASLFVFYITFTRWVSARSISTQAFEQNRFICPPQFQDCGDWYFLTALPDGYSQNTFYILLFAMMVLAGVSLLRRQWLIAHVMLLGLLLWECAYIFFFTVYDQGNYDYYQVTLTLILLLFPHKLAFLRITFVMMYFFASTVKFHSGWILGTYFTSLQPGIPLFPGEWTPLMTNSVIFMEMIGSWFLLSRNRVLQRLALTYFIIFHLYSITLVGFQYPATCLPPLLILFGPRFDPIRIPLDRRAIPGWTLILVWIALQLTAEFIPGDRKLTLEGNEIGLYMFEANHQCVSTETVIRHSGARQVTRRESPNARNRCNPYWYWFPLKQACKRKGPRIRRIAWQFDHSINGGPFFRMVDVENACDLDYRWLKHNPWIKTPQEGAPVVGYPVKNGYR